MAGSELCDDARTVGCKDSVSAVFASPGSLGLGFGFADAAEPNNSEQVLVEDGRPVRVTVTEVRPGSQGEALGLEQGLVLTHVAGAEVAGVGFARVDAALGRAVSGGRPLELRLRRPPLDLTGVRLVDS